MGKDAVKDAKKKQLTARLSEKNGKKLTVENKKTADEILAALKKNDYVVKKVEEKGTRQKNRSRLSPQVRCSRKPSTKLGFFTKKTMLIAQQLYEGIEIKGHGTVGLVTYIRTDSVRISEEALSAAKAYITEQYSKEYLGNFTYSNKKKDVQDAHEAIRPSLLELHPDDIKDSLSKDQYNLYKLIWSRFLAFAHGLPRSLTGAAADIENGDYTFRATGSRLKFDGYLKIYKQCQ